MPRNSVWHDIAIIYAPAKVKAAMLGPLGILPIMVEVGLLGQW